MSIVQLSDCGFIGHVWESNSNPRSLIFETNKIDDTLWSQKYNIVGNLIITKDGSYAIGGTELGMGCLRKFNLKATLFGLLSILNMLA